MKKKKMIMVYLIPTILFIFLMIFKEIFNLDGKLVSVLSMVIIVSIPVFKAIAKEQEQSESKE